MTETPGSPTTPAPPGPPASQRSNVVAWIALAVSGIAVLGVLAVAVVAVLAWGVGWTGYGIDYPSDWEDEYAVTDDGVRDAVDGPCERMQEAGEAIVTFMSAEQAATALGTYAESARAIARAVEDTDTADDLSLRWARNWLTHADAVDDVAAQAADGRTNPTIPDATDRYGMPIVYAIDEAAPPGCEVPAPVLRLLGDPAW